MLVFYFFILECEREVRGVWGFERVLGGKGRRGRAVKNDCIRVTSRVATHLRKNYAPLNEHFNEINQNIDFVIFSFWEHLFIDK